MVGIHDVNSYCSKRLFIILALGFASGLPLALIMGTLQAWVTQVGVDVKTIGLLGLVGLPYIFKCLWAPFLDRYALPFLGKRRGWLLLSQLALLFFLWLLGQQSPGIAPGVVGLIAFIISFCSATQDIIIDAYRTEILPTDETGQGVAMYVFGARVATFIAGGIALIISDHMGFSFIYTLMSLLMGVGIVATLLSTEPEHERTPATLLEAVVEPLAEFFKREKAFLLIAIILLYRLGDAFAGSLTNTFLLRGLDFSLTEVGAVKKTVEILSTLLGVFWGGMWMRKHSLYKALFYFGLLQAFSNLSFMLLAIIGHHFMAMVGAVFLENFCAGLGTAAFVALLTVLCNKNYTATQFALLSALAMVGRTFASPMAGVMVHHLGWTIFYFGTFLISIPGLICLKWLAQSVPEIASRPAYA